MEESNTRTRMNVSVNAKGFAQWDITAEYDTHELSAEMLGKAIGLMRGVIKEKGIKEVKVSDK
jgi:hypothetical protein